MNKKTWGEHEEIFDSTTTCYSSNRRCSMVNSLLASESVMVNSWFGVWRFCWLILGTWKTSPPCLCCILRHSNRIGTSGRPPHLLLWHGLTEPENGVREPTCYATMIFRGDWTPQSFSDNMTGFLGRVNYCWWKKSCTNWDVYQTPCK